MSIISSAGGEALPCLDTAVTLSELLAYHDHAVAINNAAWDRTSQMDAEASLAGRPVVRVQVGRLRVGADTEGKPIHKPIWDYTPEAIAATFDRYLDHALIFYREETPARQAVVDRFEADKRAKLDELAALDAERQRVEDECGYSVALAASQATGEYVEQVEQRIIDFRPRCLDDAAHMARWITTCFEEERGYINDEKQLLAMLHSVGRAFE